MCLTVQPRREAYHPRRSLTIIYRVREERIMGLREQTAWAWTVAIALVILIGTGGLMRLQHNRRGGQSSAISHALATSDAAKVPGDLPLFQREMTDAPVSKHDFDRALAEMQQKMAALRSQMRQLEHAQASRGAEQVSPSVAPTPDAAAAAHPRAQREAARQAEAQIQAQADLIEETLQTETADPNWAPAAETAIAEIFQHEELQALQLVSAECRSTLCRIDVAANGLGTDGSSFAEDLRKLLLFTPWSGQGFGRIAPDGPSPTAVFFLTREGHDLPQPTP